MPSSGCKNADLRYETPVWYPETDDLLKLLQLFKSKLREQQRTIKISNLRNGRGIKSKGKYVQQMCLHNTRPSLETSRQCPVSSTAALQHGITYPSCRKVVESTDPATASLGEEVNPISSKPLLPHASSGSAGLFKTLLNPATTFLCYTTLGYTSSYGNLDLNLISK